MNDSSNIQYKSHRVMVFINRFFLKLAFAMAILSFCIAIFRGADFNNQDIIYSSSSSVLFAFSYAVCYYFYKYFNKTKLEKVKKDPLLAQIILVMRFISFLGGLVLLVLGGSLIFSDKNVGIIVAMLGTILCQVLLSTNKIVSHFSTFFENLATGLLFSIAFICVVDGISLVVLYLSLCIIPCLLLQESFYYFFNKYKHKNELVPINEMLLIRLKYFLRNFLVYLALVLLILLLTISTIFENIIQSDLFSLIMKIIPILISVISLSFTIIKTVGVSKEEKTKDYNEISDMNNYKIKVVNFGKEVDVALNYIIKNMSTAKGISRDDGKDYYYHCVNVANILQNFGYKDEDLICTALLHDCLEDIPGCTFETIKSLTNEKVANSVVLLSKQKGVDYKVSENFDEYMQNILTDENATVVKIADRMHNMSTLEPLTPQKRKHKVAETKKHFIPFIFKAQNIYPSHEKLFDNALKHFSSLKDE